MLKIHYPGPDRPVSYHNHSNWSDGASPIEEVCRTAKKAGLREFGLSDHWVIAPDAAMEVESWRMAPARLNDYVEKLQHLRKELEDENFRLLIGLEVDFFFENIDGVLADLSQYPLDYLIGSVHFAGNFGIDHDIADWQGLSEERKREICEIYYQKLEGAAERKEFSFLGHLDLPKKYHLINNADDLPQALHVLDKVQQNGLAIELNTAGWFKPAQEQYPSLEILKGAQMRKIPVVISADAHDAKHLTRNFAEAREILRQAGYPVKG